MSRFTVDQQRNPLLLVLAILVLALFAYSVLTHGGRSNTPSLTDAIAAPKGGNGLFFGAMEGADLFEGEAKATAQTAGVSDTQIHSSSSSASSLAALQLELEALRNEVRQIQAELADARLRLREIEAPFAPSPPRSDLDQQPTAGTGTPQPVPAGLIKQPTPHFALNGVRKVQGNAQAQITIKDAPDAGSALITAGEYVLLPNGDHSPWMLLDVDVVTRSATFLRVGRTITVYVEE
ncbi:hypothetical protein [Denitratimonas sp. CY0512]|uniref:hypothetical protein n=1 Tax=Denitratimonas sp. CY0512 TaxID=3131940 RepID=UPI0030B5A5FB